MSLELRGEIGFSFVNEPNYETAHAVVRIYRAGASFAQVNEAAEREAGAAFRAVPGVLRYTLAGFDDGRIGGFAACKNAQAADQLTQAAKELRGKPGLQVATLLPHDPEVITGEIPLAFAKVPAHAHA
ncbi:MAG: hypothetical protein JO326_04470 [Acetobacteraceae bacterium]|nr:hypothetical protein [Acetobacteraceae bacterium]